MIVTAKKIRIAFEKVEKSFVIKKIHDHIIGLDILSIVILIFFNLKGNTYQTAMRIKYHVFLLTDDSLDTKKI